MGWKSKGVVVAVLTVGESRRGGNIEPVRNLNEGSDSIREIDGARLSNTGGELIGKAWFGGLASSGLAGYRAY